MKMTKHWLAMALLAWGLPLAVMAAAATDPVIGSWKLDVAQSTFKPGPAPKSETRTYESLADGSMKLTTTGESATGESTATETTYKYDGKDYPIKGSKLFDSIVVSKVDSHTSKSDLKRDGKVVGHFRRVVSHDGKKLTATTKVTGPNGETLSQTAVYTKSP